MNFAQALAPSLDDFAALAKTAFDGLPAPFRDLAAQAMIRIEDFADDELLDSLAIPDPFELTGLYEGVDLTRRSTFDPAPAQPMIFLFRRPILDEWAERGDVSLGALVTHVLVHEIAHHFGMSDDDIVRVEGA